MNAITSIGSLPQWPMDLEGTRIDIERMETEAQTHENPFADHASAPPPFPISDNAGDALSTTARTCLDQTFTFVER